MRLDTITDLNVTGPEPAGGDVHWKLILRKLLFDTWVIPLLHDVIRRTFISVGSRLIIPELLFALSDTLAKLPFIRPEPTVKINPLKHDVGEQGAIDVFVLRRIPIYCVLGM